MEKDEEKEQREREILTYSMVLGPSREANWFVAS